MSEPAKVVPMFGRLVNVVDTLQNLVSGLGTDRDKSFHSQYILNTLDRNTLNVMYRGDWIARKVVNAPAQDATREWRAWQAEGDEIEEIEKLERDFRIQEKVRLALTMARLYGGAALILGVDGAGKPDKELDLERVKFESLKFVHVVSQYDLMVNERVDDLMAPDYGEPLFYERQTKEQGAVKIHPSRVIKFIGAEVLDEDTRVSMSCWGDSVLQAVDDAVRAAGVVSGGIATLVHEAKIDIIKMPDLTEKLTTEEYSDKLASRFTYANKLKSSINSLILDKEEDWERVSMNFAQMPEILQMYLQIASGAADIPATRLLGQSPAGMNATGDSDIRNYYDRVAADQNNMISPNLERLDEILIRSATGARDENIFYDWNPLWQMTEVEKADVANKKATTMTADVTAGLIPIEVLRIGRQNQLVEDGTYPGIEIAIEEHADEISPAEENQQVQNEAMLMKAEQPMIMGAGGGKGGGDFPPKKNGKAKPFDEELHDWNEQEHPRNEEGEWTEKGGSEETGERGEARGGGAREKSEERGEQRASSAGGERAEEGKRTIPVGGGTSRGEGRGGETANQKHARELKEEEKLEREAREKERANRGKRQPERKQPKEKEERGSQKQEKPKRFQVSALDPISALRQQQNPKKAEIQKQIESEKDPEKKKKLIALLAKTHDEWLDADESLFVKVGPDQYKRKGGKGKIYNYEQVQLYYALHARGQAWDEDREAFPFDLDLIEDVFDEFVPGALDDITFNDEELDDDWRDQPRKPKGTSGAGQWTKGSGVTTPRARSKGDDPRSQGEIDREKSKEAQERLTREERERDKPEEKQEEKKKEKPKREKIKRHGKEIGEVSGSGKQWRSYPKVGESREHSARSLAILYLIQKAARALTARHRDSIEDHTPGGHEHDQKKHGQWVSEYAGLSPELRERLEREDREYEEAQKQKKLPFEPKLHEQQNPNPNIDPEIERKEILKHKLEQQFNLGGVFEDSDDRIVDLWDEHIKMDPEEFANGMIGEKLSLTDSLELDLRRDGKLKVDGFFKGGGHLEHVFDFDKKQAYLELINVPKSQPAGSTKSMMGANVELYEKLGIEKVGLYANIRDGGYAWARYGFTPTDPSSIYGRVRQRALNLHDNDLMSTDELRSIRNLASGNDPKTIWDIAAHPRGKDLLLSNSWDGELDMSDPGQVRRFKRYVGK